MKRDHQSGQRPTTNDQRRLSGFSTRAIHDGQEPDPLTGAVNVPIYASSTYVQQELGKHKGYEYARVPRLFDQVLAGYGIEFTYVDTSDTKNVERVICKNTRMVYVETPTNPLMALSDIEA